MRYPDEFDTSSFPAGKQIAVSRIVGIATMVVFLLIIVSCGLLLWVQKSAHIHPFLVSVNDITGRWEIVGHHHTETREITTTQSLQESVIGKFLEYRFRITDDELFNENIWRACNRTVECTPENNAVACLLYCLSGDKLYTDFVSNVVPEYQGRVTQGEMWTADMSSIQMLPIGEITTAGGTWQVRMTVRSTLLGPIKILAFATVAQDLTSYPKTLGYYVKEFNAYKIN